MQVLGPFILQPLVAIQGASQRAMVVERCPSVPTSGQTVPPKCVGRMEKTGLPRWSRRPVWIPSEVYNGIWRSGQPPASV